MPQGPQIQPIQQPLQQPAQVNGRTNSSLLGGFGQALTRVGEQDREQSGHAQWQPAIQARDGVPTQPNTAQPYQGAMGGGYGGYSPFKGTPFLAQGQMGKGGQMGVGGGSSMSFLSQQGEQQLGGQGDPAMDLAAIKKALLGDGGY
jgi:hypothetical protein